MPPAVVTLTPFVAPELTVTAVLEQEPPVTPVNWPELMVVVPFNVLLPDRVRLPVPTFVNVVNAPATAELLEILPENVVLALL